MFPTFLQKRRCILTNSGLTLFLESSWLFLLLLLFSSCSLGPRPMGEAGIEFTYMVPGDRIRLDVGEQGYVDADGILRGIKDSNIPAAGRKVRDVVGDLLFYLPFERYQFLPLGRREIEVRGAVRHPGIYEYPKDEDWNLMNLLIKVNGFFQPSENMDFLLVRRSWEFPGAFLFIRGEAISSEGGIGGDDMILHAGDLIIFPGKDNPIYIFGAVKDKAECFTFASNSFPTLEIAIKQAGGFAEKSDRHNILIYRILNGQKQSIFTVDWERQKGFALAPWDIIYVPPQIPWYLLSEKN